MPNSYLRVHIAPRRAPAYISVFVPAVSDGRNGIGAKELEGLVKRSETGIRNDLSGPMPDSYPEGTVAPVSL